MKLLCDREQLLAAFGAVGGVVPARSPKPILQNLKLDASPNQGSTLMATDLEVGIRLKVLGVKVDQPGSVILPLQKMGQILRASTGDDELALEVEGETLVVRGHRSEFKLPAEDPSLFPDPPDFHAETGYRISPADLRRAVRRTSFATDPDSTRYALAGVLMEPGPESITMVGTDGRRMARQIIPCEPEGEAEVPSQAPVIPVKALRLIERNLDDDEPARIAVQDGTAVLVRTGRAVIYSRLVEGRFPNYKAVMPSSYECRIPFTEVDPLLSAVEQAAIVTSKESRGVDFQFGDGLLKLASQTADIGESHVELPITYDGKDVAITFDATYLIEALKTLDPSQPIAAELIDHKSAAVFKTEDQYTYVVMPLNRDR
ncbi:DNA polymerase III subunit beta [Tautonia marina]|uniref:DNA polymerase III subunit beta n=1 Tax=Tautonia marina TaxID=2653855 RepID=UPI00126090A1|nr:DNA polymerase III subunit beta [Tautonia marina]